MAGQSEVTIDREERDGLYELVRNHLGSIEDFWVALERTKSLYRSEMRPDGALLADGKADLPGSTYATLHQGGR